MACIRDDIKHCTHNTNMYDMTVSLSKPKCQTFKPALNLCSHYCGNLFSPSRLHITKLANCSSTYH